MRDLLIRYLLGELDDAEQRQLEGRLQQSPELRRELDYLRACFSENADAPAPASPPPGLAARTADQVSHLPEDIEDAAQLTRSVPAVEPPAAAASWSLADISVAAGVFLAVGMLLMPALRGSRDRIEAEQGAGGHDDLAAMLAGKTNQMLVDEDGADAENEHGLAVAQKRLRNGGQQAGGCTFDREIGKRLELVDRHDRWRLGEMGQTRGCLAAVARGDRRQRAAGDTAIERLGNLQPDRAESGDGDPDRAVHL